MVALKRSSTPRELAETNRCFKRAILGMNKEEAYYFYDNNKGRYQYNTKETKKIFKNMTHERCSFCTQNINNFDTEMTVEHIRTKKDYPDKIFQWTNLLCSCRTCNNKRGISPYDKDKYLDPTKNVDIEDFFDYNIDGEILPNSKLTKEQQDKAGYMIKKYGLDRKDLNNKRKKFLDDLIHEEGVYEFLKKQQLSSQYIIFLSVFAYYRRCIE